MSGSSRHTQLGGELYSNVRSNYAYGAPVVENSAPLASSGRSWSFEQPQIGRSEMDFSNRMQSSYVTTGSAQHFPSYYGARSAAAASSSSSAGQGVANVNAGNQSDLNVRLAANGQSPTAAVDRKVSCLECRSSKVKCTGPVDDGVCMRCRKGGKECVFKQHSRGRKPAQAKLQSLERSVGKSLTALNDLTDHKFSNERAQVQEALTSAKESRARDGSSHGRKRIGTESDSGQDVLKRARGGDDYEDEEEEGDFAREGIEVNEGDFEADVPAEALGQPALSNPLKLLAHASDVALAGSSKANSIGACNKLQEDWDHASLGGGTIGKASNGEPSVQPVKDANVSAAKNQLGAFQRGYWDMGIYSSRPDKGSQMDPTTAGIISTETAQTLFSYFMRHLSATITLLDPVLHTFDYVQSHSAFLLTTACALAARFMADLKDAENVADKLDAHIQDVLLPAILLHGYRSVEIAQAFIVLAAFHSNTRSLDGDRSWSLVGYGIRIAAELDMNARIMSRLTSDFDIIPSSSSGNVDLSASGSDEMLQRRLRNRERTWCNLWLYDFSLSTHMGRRSTLGQDPVILGVSAGWQHAPCALPGDEAIVALIGLRRIQLKNTEFFDHTILANSLAHRQPQRRSAALAVQLEFFDKSCASDIDSWKAMYINDGRSKKHNFRTDNLSLYASYARLMLNSYALKCTKDADLLAPFYKDSYCAVMTYLTLYVERMERHGLTHVHNSSVVTVAYVAVFALKLCSLDRQRFPYIDAHSVFDHVRRLIEELRRAGNVTAWRNGAASSYAPYLAAILHRVERSTKGSAVVGVDARRDSLMTSSGRTAVQSPRTPAVGHLLDVVENAFSPRANALTTSVAPPDEIGSAHALFSMSEPTTFFAGPSGVEAYTSTTANISFTDESFHFGPHDLQQLESLGLNEASLFSDMSVFLNANFNNDVRIDATTVDPSSSSNVLPLWPTCADEVKAAL